MNVLFPQAMGDAKEAGEALHMSLFSLQKMAAGGMWVFIEN